MNFIKGNQNPVIGVTSYYEIVDLGLDLKILKPVNLQYVWYIFKKHKNGTWENITENDGKTGVKVPYKFGDVAIGVAFKLQVHKAVRNIFTSKFDVTHFADIEVMPSTNKNYSIQKVVLFNNGSKDPNKATYKDSLTARAYCIAMFNKEVEFQLWEDDAEGKGHNPEVNKNNKLPQKFTAKVNAKGIAETKISLLSNEKVLRSIANKYLSAGDKSEGQNHEYYVTASYGGKIQGASQVNVDVANSAKNIHHNTNSAIFSGTSNQPEKSDKEQKITHAYFLDNKGNPTQNLKVGDSFFIRVKTVNMKGEHFQIVVWEKDIGKPDKIFSSEKLTVKEDTFTTAKLNISQDKYDKGIDLIYGDPDNDSQSYYIEIIPLQSKVKSVSFGINDEDKRTKVDNVKTAAVVKEVKTIKNEKDPCFCNRDFKEDDVKKFVKLLKRSETIWEGQALKGGKRAVCNISDKSFATLTKSLNSSFKKYNINTCAQKMHFLAQVTEETGTFSLSEETKGTALSSQSVYKGRGLLQLTGVKVDPNDKKSLYDKPGPYKDFADYRGDQNIVKNPSVVANNVDYCIDSGAWIWSVYKKMTSNPKSDAIKKWGDETLGKSLNELAVYVDKYFELISVLLNGRNSKTKMPNGYEKRKSNYNLLKTIFFNYDHYHKDNQKTVSAKDIVTYHIFSDGNIEKHIPKIIKSGFERQYKYVYHDAKDIEHEICTVEHSLVQKWIKGSKLDGGQGWEKRSVGKKVRYFQKGTGQSELIKMILPINYEKDEVRIKIGDNTSREYINPITFASLLGAVAECGYKDFNFNGSTSQDGTGAPSVSHVNGVSFDFRYLRKDKTANNLHIDTEPDALDIVREEKFIDALIKFGYSQFYSYTITVNGKKFILKNSTSLADHNHHLHIRREGYNPKFKEVKD